MLIRTSRYIINLDAVATIRQVNDYEIEFAIPHALDIRIRFNTPASAKNALDEIFEYAAVSEPAYTIVNEAEYTNSFGEIPGGGAIT